MPVTISYDIAILGAGRLGQTLGRAWAQLGHQIVAVSCRSLPAAAHAVTFIGAGQPVMLDELVAMSLDAARPVLLIATPDDAIASVAAWLAHQRHDWQGGTVFHCSGALSSELLNPLGQGGAAIGSMHPLYAFGEPLAARQALSGVHWSIEGNAAATAIARDLIYDLDGHIHEIQPQHKTLYHAAASLAGNHLAGLLRLSFSMLEQCGLAPEQARDMLLPLSAGLLQRMQTEGEVAALAGPISRGDSGTVAQHLAALQALPPVYREVYCSLGGQLVDMARQKGVPASALAEIMHLLHA